MRLSIQLTILAFIVMVSLLSLPTILKDRVFKSYGDEQLRQRALDRSMLPIPKTYEELLKIVDTKDNPMTLEKIALGKELFFDKSLSKNKDINCATCHSIKKENIKNSKTLLTTITSKNKTDNCTACHLEEQSGTDRLSTAVGHNGKQNPFHLNTLTILNSSLAKYLTWSGSSKNIEHRIEETILSEHEMAMSKDEVEKRLMKNETYQKSFETAFKNEIGKSETAVNFENVKKAIAVFVRTLLTRGSYDRFLEGDNQAISEKAKRGLTHFINLGCKGCHTGMSVGGQSMQRFPIRHFATIHDLRPNFQLFPEIKRVNIDFPFENKGGFKGQEITNKFRVPILRNVTKTSPYFHNGSVDKIEEAVAIMGKNQLGINLSTNQIEEIVAFLKTLEGDIVNYTQNHLENKRGVNESN